MKTGTSVLLVLTLLTLAVSASAYYNVSVISISPSGDISAGSTVTVNLILNFTAPTEKGSFNSSNNLNFVSDLRQPAWQMTLTTDGLSRATVEKTGSSVYYNGFSISQPPGVMESMTVVMKGTAPSSSLNGTINVLTIQESDEYNRAFPGTITTYSANLVSATPTSTPTTKPTTIATQETTVAPTSLPTTLPTTVVTATASPSPTATPDTGILQTIKSLPLMYIGIGILILVIILVVIILIVRRSREYEEDEEYEDANEEYDDEDYEDRPRR